MLKEWPKAGGEGPQPRGTAATKGPLRGGNRKRQHRAKILAESMQGEKKLTDTGRKKNDGKTVVFPRGQGGNKRKKGGGGGFSGWSDDKRGVFWSGGGRGVKRKLNMYSHCVGTTRKRRKKVGKGYGGKFGKSG